MQHIIREAGKTATVEEHIDIAQRRARLSIRITSHQRQARKFLDLTDEEEDDQSYSYHDSHVFVDDDNGDPQLLPISTNSLPQKIESVDRPECFLLAMPSNLGERICRDRRLEVAVKAEMQLREGQMNDALQGVRLAIGKKAFIFQAHVRSARSKKIKTRAYTLVQSMDTTLRYHAQLYRRARTAVQSLGATVEFLNKFQSLEPDDLKTSTTFLNSSVGGMKHRHLSWVWYLDVEGDSVDDNVMKECKCSVIYWVLIGKLARSNVSIGSKVYRVNWLRARENFKRAEEEVRLVWHEMDWTIRFFKYQATTWESRKSMGGTPGHLSYARRMESMWMKFAFRADQAFTLVKVRFPSPLEASI